MRRLFLLVGIIALIISAFFPGTAFSQEDAEGSKDHPMISRYEGSYIKSYEHYDYNRLVFGYKTDGGEKEEITTEGEVTRIAYAVPKGLSSLQVHRNYLIALKNAGFEILFNCIDEGGEECHWLYWDYDKNIDGKQEFFRGKYYHYFLARLSDSEGDVYVSAHTVLRGDKHPATALQVVEEKPLETGKVKVDTNVDAIEDGSAGNRERYAEKDAEGSKDHPMISRYENSVIKGYEHYDYDRLVFGYKTDDGEEEEITTEGEVTRIAYAAPKGLSSLQVHRNYLIALKNAGFEILFNCIDEGGEECHWLYCDYDINIDGNQEFFRGKDYHYFLAKLSNPEGDVYVSAHTVLRGDKHPATALQIVEEKPMETGKVKVNIDAEAMANDIDEKGSVRIYGVHFDTDKATIKEKSESTLDEIAKLMKQNSGINLHVVGHTDATGSMEHNMELSKKRAQAVVEFLTSEKGVSADRLTSYGVGPLAPVASNEEKDGRARNRRVELVKK